MHKITYETETTRFEPLPPTPSSRTEPSARETKEWHTQAIVQGNAKVVAGALRALADEIDPPKPTYRD